MSKRKRKRKTKRKRMSNRTLMLEDLGQRAVFPPKGQVVKRWGQLLREAPGIREFLKQGVDEGRLVPLHAVADLHGGVVTRANAYFIVREVPFEEIPERFRLTKNDYKSTAVVMDGLGTPAKIERPDLRTVIKGPEALVSPTRVEKNELRLFVVTRSKDELRKLHANGALAYLERGETVSYRVSKDKLKGGIPAKRSNIRNRKPFWYSLSIPTASLARIVVPEHLDRRCIATLVDGADSSVVIDKLYVIHPNEPADAPLLVASLNSLLTWYQLELRGRTQLGEGVLEAKVPDWQGVLVLNPARLSEQGRIRLLKLFQPLADLSASDSLAAAQMDEQVLFDTAYLKYAVAVGPAGALN